MQYLNTALEIVAPVLGVILTIILPMVVSKLMQKWNIELEAKHRDALQSALHNAALRAVARYPYADLTSGSANAAVDTAINYVRSSVPDALDKFEIFDNTEKLRELIEPHLAQVFGQKKR